jgi:hypothetical protein
MTLTFDEFAFSFVTVTYITIMAIDNYNGKRDEK